MCRGLRRCDRSRRRSGSRDPGAAPSHAYAVKVNGQDVPVNDEDKFDFHTAMFCMDGPVTVEVRVKGGAEGALVRPYRHRINPQVDGDLLTFTLGKPLKLVLQAKGRPNLALLATPVEADLPKPGDANLLYFAPGVHKAGVIRPQTGQTIYLAPGALVKGRIEARNVKDVTVKGRGVLDANGYSVRANKTCAILFDRCSNIKVEGIGVRGGTWWQTLYLLTDDVEVSHMNIIGKSVNTDGIDIDGVRRFVARDCFIRAEDDGFGWHALDARANGEPPTRDALAEDCVIWNTAAGNGLRVGASMETQLFENITFRNIDVLQHAGAAIYSDHSDWATCRNIRFENFADETPEGKTIHVEIRKTRYSNDNGFRDERGRYDGLHFVNVTSPGGGIELRGFDEEHRIDNVTFENCMIGGNSVDGMDDVKVNEFVRNVTFRPASVPPSQK